MRLRFQLPTFALVAASVAACSGAPDETGGGTGGGAGGGTGAGGEAPIIEATFFESGSRLEARTLVGGGGALLTEFFDTELNILCKFQRTTTGELRCLPPITVEADALAFGDDACTEPAIVSTTCGDPPDAVTLVEFDTCRDVAVGVWVAASAAVPGTGYRENPPGTCTPIYVMDQSTVVSPATPLPLETFVLGTTENVVVSGDVGVQRLVAEDGAWMTLGILRDGHWCEPADIGGELRCADVLAAEALLEDVPLYREGSCTGDRVASYPDVCGGNDTKKSLVSTPLKAGLAVEWTSDGAGCNAPTYYELGADQPTAYFAQGNACSAIPAAAVGFADLGAAVAPASLPLIETVATGAGRLRPLAYATAGTPLVPTGDFYDTETDSECSAQEIVGGTLRCLPAPSDIRFYADSSCLQPLLAPDGLASFCGARSTRWAYEVTGDTTGCFPDKLLVETVLEQGAAHVGDVYEAAGGCHLSVYDGEIYSTVPRAMADFAELTE